MPIERESSRYQDDSFEAFSKVIDCAGLLQVTLKASEEENETLRESE